MPAPEPCEELGARFLEGEQLLHDGLRDVALDAEGVEDGKDPGAAGVVEADGAAADAVCLGKKRVARESRPLCSFGDADGRPFHLRQNR